MTSISTFAYGITVMAIDLMTAAEAWIALPKAFKFFELLFLRHRQGNLKFTGSKFGLVAAKVPMELWENIRVCVVGVEITQAEQRLVRRLSPSCTTLDGSHKHPTWGSWVDADARMSCHDCEEEIMILDDYMLISGQRDIFDPIHKLLAAFGLAHPLPVFMQAPSLDVCMPFNRVALIALPLRGSDSSGTSTLSAESGGPDGPNEQSLVEVCLDLPTDADVRLERFVKLFSIRVTNSTLCTLGPVHPQTIAQERLNEPRRQLNENFKSMSGMKLEAAKEIKPGWKLYTSCYKKW